MEGSVTISLNDFNKLVESSNDAKSKVEKTRLAAKELQVFLSFLISRSDISPYLEEFNRQSKSSTIVVDGGMARIQIKNEEENNS
tara:strand:- start:938 stop:1192 length:255 start_codon:yes stop_codon:yes gene_type:complete